MNLKIIGKYLSYLLLTEGLFMLLICGVAAGYGEAHALFGLGAGGGICLALGGALFLACRRENGQIYVREGFVVAGGGWVALSLCGALPFVLSGDIPHYIDALFETVSGFTTTGSSILTNVEAMSHGLLFWRSFTHWLGGIGVLFFILLVVQAQRGKGFTMYLLRAETTGPQVGKVLPKTRDSVRMLFAVYAGLSVVNLLFLLAGGMPLFDAACTMMGTAGTGGFGIKADSMASYSPYLQWVTTVFMALFGINFALYYYMLRRQWREALLDEELRVYLGLVLGSSAVVALTLWLAGVANPVRHGAFAVSSIITTTGYATLDFNLWPETARTVLVILMVCGAMAGSTGGGVKSIRLLILAKSIKAGMHRLVHPRGVKAVKINGKQLDDEVSSNVTLYFSVYAALATGIFLLLSLEGHGFETDFTAMLTCFNNVGPGLGLVGPTGSFAIYSYPAKLLLSVAMLMGRLEIFPVLLLFLPSTWRRNG